MASKTKLKMISKRNQRDLSQITESNDSSEPHTRPAYHSVQRGPAHLENTWQDDLGAAIPFPITSNPSSLAPTSFLSRFITPTDDWSHFNKDNSSVTSSSSSARTPGREGSSKKTSSLSHQPEPQPNDVVCGRGKGSYNCPGNRKFRAVVKRYMHQYASAKTKVDKSAVLHAVLNAFTEATGGRFVKWDKTSIAYVEIPLSEAREKVGHAMREALAAEELVEGKQEAQQAFQLKHKSLLEKQKAIFEKMLRESR